MTFLASLSRHTPRVRAEPEGHPSALHPLPQVLGDLGVAGVDEAALLAAGHQHAVDVLDVAVVVGALRVLVDVLPGNGLQALGHGVVGQVGTDDDADVVDLKPLDGENAADLVDALLLVGPRVGSCNGAS